MPNGWILEPSVLPTTQMAATAKMARQANAMPAGNNHLRRPRTTTTTETSPHPAATSGNTVGFVPDPATARRSSRPHAVRGALPLTIGMATKPIAETNKPPKAPETLPELRPFPRAGASALVRSNAAGAVTTSRAATGPQNQDRDARRASYGARIVRTSADRTQSQTTTNGTTHRCN